MSAFFAPAPDQGLLRLTGRDRVAFLHNMTTSHVKRLQPGEGQPAAIVDQRAQVLDWGGVHADPGGEALWVTTAPGRAADVAAWLDKYLITEDVAVEDQAGTLGLLFLTGDGAAEVLAQAAGRPIPAWTTAEATLGGHATRVFGAAGYGGPGYLLAAAPDALDAVGAALAAAGAVAADAATMEAARIAAGVPAFGHELGGRTNPWEARLEEAIALDKGCYLGQEVVARLHSYDKVQRLLVGLDLPAGAAAAPGTPLFLDDAADARPVGELTSANAEGALALVKRAHAEPGTPLLLRPDGGQAIPVAAAARAFWAQRVP